MDELALFAGVGGGILGGRLLGWRTVCAVEIDPFCREVLLRRQLDRCLPRFPIWDDIRTFDGKPWHGFIEVITAGFPCQPFSVAGPRLGEKDDRNLWPETVRVISEVQSRFVLLENVPGIRRYLPVVIRDLRRLGYRVERPTVIAAASVGAGHIRRRIWIFADRDGEQLWNQPGWCGRTCRKNKTKSQSVLSNGKSVGCNSRPTENRYRSLRPNPWWSTEPGVDRVVYGLPDRVDRIKALGNAQVPAVVRLAWDTLSK